MLAARVLDKLGAQRVAHPAVRELLHAKVAAVVLQVAVALQVVAVLAGVADICADTVSRRPRLPAWMKHHHPTRTLETLVVLEREPHETGEDRVRQSRTCAKVEIRPVSAPEER